MTEYLHRLERGIARLSQIAASDADLTKIGGALCVEVDDIRGVLMSLDYWGEPYGDSQLKPLLHAMRRERRTLLTRLARLALELADGPNERTDDELISVSRALRSHAKAERRMCARRADAPAA